MSTDEAAINVLLTIIVTNGKYYYQQEREQSERKGGVLHNLLHELMDYHIDKTINQYDMLTVADHTSNQNSN